MRKTVVWPIGRWERTFDGGREVAFPVLWPYDSPSLREYGEPWRPFVSVYRRRTWPSGHRDTTALFGLHEPATAEKECASSGIHRLGQVGRDALALFWALRFSGP
jgi:hypothetical protein